MNFSAIKTFLAIAETTQLNRAATQLNVTQSTVTARLNSLEEEIGQKLFHRRKSGAELTAAGFRFERYAQLMMDVWRQARQEAGLPQGIDATFNLGCHPDLWPVVGEILFERIRENQANVALSAWSGDQQQLDRWLNSGLINAALCYTPTLSDNRREFRLNSENLVLVSTTPRQLMRWDPEYIYVDGGEEFRKSHAAAYSDGDTPTTIFGSAIWAKDFLMQNHGSGYLSERLIKSELESGKFHIVPDAPSFSRNVYLVVNRDMDKYEWLSDIVSGLAQAEVNNFE